MGSINKFLMAILFLSTITTSTQAQNTDVCLRRLTPCSSYLNTTTTPPDSCCNLIKEATTNNCVCVLYSPAVLQSFNINFTKAVQLTQRCGFNDAFSGCKQAEAPIMLPPLPPPGVPGNDCSKMTWSWSAGLPNFLSLGLYLLFH